jgi:uncharacterized protein
MKMRNKARILTSAALLMAFAQPSFAAHPASIEMTAPGPEGNLAGSLLQADNTQPLVLIIPGSGPTDRDGNSPLGITSASYLLLAEELAKQGVATLRIDKRGMFGSKAAIADPNKVAIGDYADDVHSWVKALQAKTGRKCLWVLGHSEGGLVALMAGQRPDEICGVIALSAAGRPMGVLLREQLNANPANAPILADAMRAISELESGRTIDVSAMHPALRSLFDPAVQGFLINQMALDPSKLAASLKLPLLIVQGDKDLQVTLTDAQALKAAQPKAQYVLIPGMTHALKHVDSDDVGANYATYANAAQPVDPGMAGAIVKFVRP